jgi:hypothetical protein
MPSHTSIESSQSCRAGTTVPLISMMAYQQCDVERCVAALEAPPARGMAGRDPAEHIRRIVAQALSGTG